MYVDCCVARIPFDKQNWIFEQFHQVWPYLSHVDVQQAHLARRDFAEIHNDVLRRLLGVEEGEADVIPCATSGEMWSHPASVRL